MILIISTCKESLHDYEFVRPIEKILKKNKIKFKTLNYRKISKKDFNNCEKIIISGTSFRDNEFINHVGKFKPLLKFDKPILGIGAGFQILSSLYNSNLIKGKELGVFIVNFKENFLGLFGKQKIYLIHRYSSEPSCFEVYAKTKYIQAAKHKSKPIYGTLFHPEIYNPELILNFSKLKF